MSKPRAQPVRQASGAALMPEEEGAEGAEGGVSELDFPNPAVLMPNILDKLKLLNYEELFCEEMMNGDLLHQAYFAVPHPKPNEQFFYFVSLFSWLMKMNRFQFARPDQFDDPNTTVANIMDALRRARIQVDYPPAKIKQGHGEAVCYILDLLTDGALENAGIRFAHPVYPADTYPEEAPVDEDEEVSADIADTVGQQADDDDEEEVYQSNKANKVGKDVAVDVQQHKIMESTVDPTAWKVEVENVAPMLKMRVEADNKEWRTHLETTKEFQDNINSKVPSTKENLGKLASTISGAMDSISTREKYLNSQYKGLVAEFHEIQESLQEVTKHYDERNTMVAELTNQLTQISDELEIARSQVDERGDSMTDTGPLVKLKDAMKKIKKEIRDMDLRIGTVAHNLLHIKMAQEHNKGEGEHKDRDRSDDED